MAYSERETTKAILEARAADVARALSLPTSLGRGPSLSDMLEPGFKSDEPSTWKSKKEEKKGEMTKKTMGAIPRTRVEENAVLDEQVDPQEMVALKIAAHYGAQPKSFMMGEPASVTVKKADGSFSKRPMIGGETFMPTSCYVGKKKTLIHVMKPQEAADYVTAEFGHADAKRMFSGFTEYIREAGDSELERIAADGRKKAADEAERAKNAAKFDQYADLGFGSW